MHYLCIMFKQRISRYIEEKSLFGKFDKVLVALSGGADSVALLRVLIALGYQCEGAHCNFHLRGEESDRDEEFVRRLCKSLSVSLHVTHFKTEEYASNHHISVEMAARELRYRWFEELRKKRGAKVIAVAHHRDDSVETFLLNLIRGTGINGLKGISVKNGYVVRPLLEENRESVLEYLEYLKQDYVIDSTNLQDAYMRNKIRLNLLPMMGTLNPSINESIAQTAVHLSEAASIYNKVIGENIQKIVEEEGKIRRIHFKRLQDCSILPSLLFEILHPYGFNAAQIKDIGRSVNTQSGKRFQSASHEILRDRDILILRPLESDIREIPKLAYNIVELTPDFVIPHDKCVACIDAGKVKAPLEVRLWRAGDKFCPLGMSGKKNVSDYLTDRKFTLFQKERQYVACYENQIVWLINERIDNRFRITPASERALIVTVEVEFK